MRILFFFLLMVISLRSFAQINPEKVTYQLKIEKYNRMKTAGLIMIVAGGAMTVLGFPK
jgi:hypothetical protein